MKIDASDDLRGDFCLDRFSDACLRALEKVETIKMKTNILGLNISLDDFDALYNNIRNSFSKDYDRIIDVVNNS
jgi:hypothetical protein